jgi:hypothetical protein
MNRSDPLRSFQFTNIGEYSMGPFEASVQVLPGQLTEQSGLVESAIAQNPMTRRIVSPQ